MSYEALQQNLDARNFDVVAVAHLGVGLFSPAANIDVLQQNAAGGAPRIEHFVGGVLTALPAGVENPDVFWDLSHTVQFATGALTLQRAVKVSAPTYAFVGASTLQGAATFAIDSFPKTGANATIDYTAGLLAGSADRIAEELAFYGSQVDTLISVNHTTTAAGSGVFNNHFGVDVWYDANPTANTDDTFGATTFNLSTASGNIRSFNGLMLCTLAQLMHNGTGTVTLAGGIRSNISTNSSGGISTAIAYDANIFNTGTATIALSKGYNFATPFVPIGSTVTASHGYYVNDIGVQAGTFTSSSGLTVEALTSAVNNTHILLGTGTIPAGQHLIYGVMPVAAANLTAGTENSSIFLDLSRTATFATGAITLQREINILRPTYAFAGASTIEGAATMAINGFPISGANATINYAAGILAGSADRIAEEIAFYFANVDAQISVNHTSTSAGLGLFDSHYGIDVWYDANPGANTDDNFGASSFNLSTVSGNTRLFNGLMACTLSQLMHNGTGSMTLAVGTRTNVSTTSTGGITEAHAYDAFIFNTGTATIGTAKVFSTGTPFVPAGSTVSNFFAFYYADFGAQAGTFTGSVGLAVEGLTSAVKNTHILLGTGTIPAGQRLIYGVMPVAAANLTAGTENTSVFLDLSRIVTFATGAIALQREMSILAPTYAFAAASVITTAATLAVDGAPVAGTNATITTPAGVLIGNNAPTPFFSSSSGNVRQLLVNSRYTNVSPSTNTAVDFNVEWNNTAVANKIAYTQAVSAIASATNTQAWGILGAVDAIMHHGGSGTITTGIAFSTDVGTTGTGTISQARGYLAFVATQGAGNITNAEGYITSIGSFSGAGTITSVRHFVANQTFKSAGAITSAAAFVADQQNQATNNTMFLSGTTVLPTGNWFIHDTSGYASTILGFVTIGATAAPATSGLLDLSSTTGSLIVSRMTTAQKNALTAVDGMILYDSTLALFQFRQAGAWVGLSSGSGALKVTGDGYKGFNFTSANAVGYTQVTASTAEADFIVGFTIENTGGGATVDDTLLIATGGAGSEVVKSTVNIPILQSNGEQIVMLPFPLLIPATTRIAIKSSSSSNYVVGLIYVKQTDLVAI